MPSLVDQWDAILAEEPSDWENLFVEMTLEDTERMEEAGLAMCSLNPWHGESWRSGWFRFRVARTFGYGSDDQLARSILGRVDAAGIGGELKVLRSVDRFLPVHTQGTV